MTIMKWIISGQGYKQLTRFSRFVLSKPAAIVRYKRLTLPAASIFVTESLLIYIYLLLFEENHENRICRAGEQNFSNDFVFFPVK